MAHVDDKIHAPASAELTDGVVCVRTVPTEAGVGAGAGAGSGSGSGAEAGTVTIHPRTGSDVNSSDTTDAAGAGCGDCEGCDGDAGVGPDAAIDELQRQPRVASSGPYRMHLLVPDEATGEVPDCDCGECDVRVCVLALHRCVWSWSVANSRAHEALRARRQDGDTWCTARSTGTARAG